MNRNTPDPEQEIINCYEKSGDIALLYLQEAEKVRPVCVVCELPHSFHWLFFATPLSQWVRPTNTYTQSSLWMCGK